MNLSSKNILLSLVANTKKEVLGKISDFMHKQGVADNAKDILEGFLKREKEFSTGFEDGFAIPHVRVKAIKKAILVYAKLKKGVDWKSIDGKNAKYIFAIAVPENEGNEHLETLSRIASQLVYKEFQNEIINAKTKKEIEKVFNDFKPKNKSIKHNHYEYVAVTSCPTGVAHTNMAAEALEKKAQEKGLSIKVERQAAQGVISGLSTKEIEEASYVIIATGRPIDGKERFNGKKVLEVKVSEPLKDAGILFEKAKKAPILNPGKSPKKGRENNSSSERVGIMAALMNGLSYMIPVVIVGGLLIAIGLGIGRMATGQDVTQHPGTLWFTLFQIGVAGLQLMIVVLGGYIAYAIGGRVALAPAMILSFLCQGIGQGAVNYLFFNYQSLEFGVKGSNLGFFGSIAAGLLVGYGAFYWNKYVSIKMPKALKSIEPIIIVPILFVIIGWLLFGFAFYLPLYYLSLGLNNSVNFLVKHNLLWIAGALGGAMLCFDLGGPINKIAFGTGVALIKTHPEVMGAIAAAGAVAPIGSSLGWLIGKKIFKLKKFNGELEKENFVPAIFMGTLGISEGAIPYAIRFPKSTIIANVIGGAIAGGLSGLFLITDMAAHTGPIVYILGAIGINGQTDYLYGLLYILSFAIGSLVTMIIFPSLEKFYEIRDNRKNKLSSFQKTKDNLKK